MRTTHEIIAEAAAETYPGTSFSPEVHRIAVDFLDRDMRHRAAKALRKAIMQYRPPVQKPAAKPSAGSIGNNPSPRTT